jgi:hypothetical protein
MWLHSNHGQRTARCGDIAQITDVPVARAAAARTWLSMLLPTPIACCVVMQRTLGAAIEKVVSEPSPFGRSLLRLAE